MLGAGGGACQELPYERPPHTLPAAIRAHVHAVLDTVPIARPCPKVTERAKPGDPRCIPRHDQRKTLPHLGIEPGLTPRRRVLFLRVDGGRIANDFVVDRENLRKIAASRAVDHRLTHESPCVAGPPIILDQSLSAVAAHP